MPVPTRTSTRPPISSEMIASRTDARLTPSDVASSRSAGSRVPGRNSPLRDQLRDLVGDLAVQPAGLDGLQRQERTPPDGQVESPARIAAASTRRSGKPRAATLYTAS